MPQIPENAKKPADRKAKDEAAADPTMKFERDGKTYESLPMSQALTAELVLDQPDPETVSDWEKMRFSLRLTMSAFRSDPEALAIIRTMSLDEIGQLEAEVSSEAGIELGE